MHPTAEELKTLPALAALSADAREDVRTSFVRRAYQKNAIVVTEGDEVSHSHFILSGSSQAFWLDASGSPLKLGIDGPGAHFPDSSLTAEPAGASWAAVTDLRVARIRLADLQVLIRRHPPIAEVMLMEVAARLRRMFARAKMLTTEDVYGRVIRLLLAAATGEPGAQVAERLTQAEIGQRIGATREMVGRVLRALVQGGYIRMEPGHIVILRQPPARW
jgi:CRP/FNR family cyclic AMP-dependent transcriptional regulator